MRILITGAGGYIGRACVRGFAQQGWTVRAASRSPQPLPGVEPAQVAAIDGETSWGQHLQGVDAVLHLAGVAHQPHTDADTYRRVNADGTRQLARAAAASGVRRFVFVSSIAVYSRKAATQGLDEASPLAPDDPYGRSKAEAEVALVEAAQGSVMTWTVIRPPLVYGPDAPGNFRRLVGLVRRGIPLPLAAANAPRSYIGLDNLVSALECAARQPEAANQAYLVSDGEEAGTAQLIRWIAQGLARPPRLFCVPEAALRLGAAAVGRASDAARLLDPLRVDSRRFRDTLRWQPPVSFEEGVRHSVASASTRAA